MQQRHQGHQQQGKNQEGVFPQNPVCNMTTFQSSMLKNSSSPLRDMLPALFTWIIPHFPHPAPHIPGSISLHCIFTALFKNQNMYYRCLYLAMLKPLKARLIIHFFIPNTNFGWISRVPTWISLYRIFVLFFFV